MKRKQRVLCYGDSNTWGYMPGNGTRYPEDVRWTGRLAQCENLEIIEEGLNGRTTVFSDNLEPFRNGLDYAAPCLMSHFPLDVIIVMLGTNDAKCRYHVSAAEIRYGLEELVARMQEFCRRKEESPRFLIISPAYIHIQEDAEFDHSSESKIRQLEAEYEQMAGEFHFMYLRASDYVTDIGEDGIHFTEEGHKNLADAVRNVLTESCLSL
ncbi:GDSL-type esterase/lipase family protein [Muricomes intestini]|uniref:Lysophospholipase L1-like esterase n=1 Tax=Muricomes intestini TaxID=1796634 RepID=A0A4R3KFD5_9FIRM|nr:GDSL-type esterase/lipase family protein [Muricomes intestini]TCS81699.1 lysophospholipase L1-like esterase [Muricomes intestini]HBI72371.1 GDSL family lipase [Lachnospiraceae bacterium]HCR82709.1 GDSL family lipase [Lachnospiraceae bacterium]